MEAQKFKVIVKMHNGKRGDFETFPVTGKLAAHRKFNECHRQFCYDASIELHECIGNMSVRIR